MNFEKLQKEGKVEKVEKSKINFQKVNDDLKAAKDSFDLENYEWAMSIAYNAVFRMGNYLMNFLGYRAVGKEHHKNLFEFLVICEIDNFLAEFFDKIRIKRNNFIYRNIDEVGKEEAEEIIKNAESFVHKIRTFVHKIRTEKKEDKK